LAHPGSNTEAAQHACDINAKHFLGEAVAAKLEMPEADWFKKQREGLGVESWLHGMIKVAGADQIIQHGCDETGIYGQGTYNQWVAIKTDGQLDIIVIEAGAILVDGTAKGCADHIKESFGRGQRATLEVREKLAEHCGPEVCDSLVPLARGGVRLLKIGRTMNDCCPTAEKVPDYLQNSKRKMGRGFTVKRNGLRWMKSTRRCLGTCAPTTAEICPSMPSIVCTKTT
jgi:hypothetical protein